ncbi:Adaptive-response sensory-kinase SasA [anaerobic digester metagenome]
MAGALSQQNEELQAQEEELRQQLDALALSREALWESEQRVRRTLERLLSPGDDLPDLELVDLLDLGAMQNLLDEFQQVTGIEAGLVDPQGRIVVGTRWQTCCADFHRVNPETLRNCIESDLVLSGEIPPGESRLYRCRNNLWDIASPIMLGRRRLGTLISGQFFFADEEPDERIFREQARRYGFDEEAYLAAIRAIPRLPRATVEGGISFLQSLAGLISSLGYSNLRLARALIERDALTATLERSREHLSRAEEIAHLGSWELDLVTHTLSWSDEVYRILGLQPGEREPSFDALLDAAHPDDREAVATAYSDYHFDGQDGFVLEHRIVRHGNGEVRWVHEKCDPQRDANGRSIRLVGLFHDITDRKQVEQSLQEYAARLRASNEELQRFAYVASHDLQEPLRSIVSFSQLVDRRYRGQLDADADEYFGYIVEGGQRMQALIQDLLLVSRVETGARPMEPVDAGAVMKDVLHSLGVSLDLAGATVVVDHLPTVMADPSQLELVFLNLVGNALKYHRPGIPASIHVRAEREGSFWRFSVEDNGIGIEPAYFDRIFVMFQRLHTRDEYEGTGIGLAIVKKVVERHGGEVRVESVPGEGSTFSFTLPAA